jgi:hypothetical protein
VRRHRHCFIRALRAANAAEEFSIMSAQSEKSQIELSDYGRILLGDAPALFLAEVLARTVIIFFITMLVVRLMANACAVRSPTSSCPSC